MSEMYWFTVLGNLSDTFVIITICFALGAIAGLLATFFYFTDTDDKQPFKFTCKIVAIITPILILGDIFIPSKTDLYAIYGVGTILDYCQGNNEVKKIPDNAVKAINSYLESITEKNKKDDSNK